MMMVISLVIIPLVLILVTLFLYFIDINAGMFQLHPCWCFWSEWKFVCEREGVPWIFAICWSSFIGSSSVYFFLSISVTSLTFICPMLNLRISYSAWILNLFSHWFQEPNFFVFIQQASQILFFLLLELLKFVP